MAESATLSLILLLLGFVTLVLTINPQRVPERICGGGQYVAPRGRAVFVCTTLAPALVLWFAMTKRAAGRLLLLLGVGLSAASWFLLVEPPVGYAIAVYRAYSPGCDGYAHVIVLVFGWAAVTAAMYATFAAEALFGFGRAN